MIYWLYIPAAVIISGLLLDRLFTLDQLPATPWLAAVSFLSLAAGAYCIGLATRDFARYGEGTPNPRRPPKRLVTGGIYQRCRHPMFFGYDLAALAIIFIFRSPGMLYISFPLFLFMQVQYLKKEERYLMRRYGEVFADYKRKVPFLLPSLRNRR